MEPPHHCRFRKTLTRECPHALTGNPEIVIKRRRMGNHGVTEITCVLLNNSTAPIYYSGYTPESSSPRMPIGHISPLYRKQVRFGAEWELKELGWCGNGACQMRLLPGHAGEFNVYLHSNEKEIKIGVCLSAHHSLRMDDMDVLWSNAITVPE
jgi:hypothetical protein